MLEFLIFLNSKEEKILDLIQKANYKIVENSPLCLIDNKFFGFLKKKEKIVVICTKNAKDYGGYNFAKDNATGGSFKTGLMIRRALRHESVHIAQECNDDNLINSSKGQEISPYKLNALRASVQLVGNPELEYEAYSMEDNPRKIISALKRFCF
ncbi:serine hydroxymethyltransferase [Prochlorococcus marinus]|uniref:serine hydroxymethyltransferase n=1 Tax=Prochlorococcus marinus TaxID=1219 RepID=UPI0022B2D5DA|nr:serine hydroxymethyltransferase [Prochlorococcus marinus]